MIFEVVQLESHRNGVLQKHDTAHRAIAEFQSKVVSVHPYASS